jgi:acyl carrier protein
VANTQSEIQNKVVEILVEQLGINSNDVIPSASIIADLGADSLDTVELVMAFEEEFGLEIPDDIAETIVTVRDIVNYIRNNT